MRSSAVLVLLSLGKHPVSGRVRRAERDARALTLALRLGGPVVGVHAGSQDPVLRDYIGMGLQDLVTLDVGADANPVPALAAYALSQGPRLVLAGTVSEAGHGSGLVPYLVADALGLPLLPVIAEIVGPADRIELIQALPRGGRRALRPSTAVMATVDRQASDPGQVAHGRALRGRFHAHALQAADSVAQLMPAVVAVRPSRQRPKRLAPVSGDSSGGRRLMVRPSPQEAAETIVKFLESERLLSRQSAAGAHDGETTT